MSNIVAVDPRPNLTTGNRPTAIVPTDMDSAYRLAKAVCMAGMAPRGMETPEKCMIAIMRGLEVGLTPFMALDKIAIVNGRPTIWGDGAIGLVRGSGLCEFVKERIEGANDARVAVCETKRRGEPEPIRRTFSVLDAKKAGLWGKQGPWQQYPERMLQMRARAFALRDGFADVLGGLYLKEEIDDGPAPAQRTPIARDEPPPPPPAAIERPAIAAPTPVEDLVITTLDAIENAAEWNEVENDGPPSPAAKPDGLEIPANLRRAKDADALTADEILTALGDALSGCEDSEQVHAAQQCYLEPHRTKLSRPQHAQAMKLVMQTLERISEGAPT